MMVLQHETGNTTQRRVGLSSLVRKKREASFTRLFSDAIFRILNLRSHFRYVPNPPRTFSAYSESPRTFFAYSESSEDIFCRFRISEAIFCMFRILRGHFLHIPNLKLPNATSSMFRILISDDSTYAWYLSSHTHTHTHQCSIFNNNMREGCGIIIHIHLHGVHVINGRHANLCGCSHLFVIRCCRRHATFVLFSFFEFFSGEEEEHEEVNIALFLFRWWYR